MNIRDYILEGFYNNGYSNLSILDTGRKLQAVSKNKETKLYTVKVQGENINLLNEDIMSQEVPTGSIIRLEYEEKPKSWVIDLQTGKDN